MHTKRKLVAWEAMTEWQQSSPKKRQDVKQDDNQSPGWQW
jgi:hypothetical protein